MYIWDTRYETMNREEIELFQLEKLQAMLNRLYLNVPYYKRIFNENKITPQDIKTLSDIKKLPLMDKEVLKNNKNITILNCSGKNGLSQYAPFDRILTSASADKIPIHLLSQLKENGIIVASVQYSIIKLKKNKGKITKEEFPGFAFVPMRK